MNNTGLSSAPQPPLLEVRALKKNFPVRSGFLIQRTQFLNALDNVSLAFSLGRTTGVVGESGCGKSTLAKIMVRLEAPTEGQVLYQGKEVHKLHSAELKKYQREVQLIFQDPYSSLPTRMSIRQILTEPLIIHQIGSAPERLQRAKELLEMVGLKENDLKRYPHQFSGGQRQRISIARALTLEPHLLICDEPVSALDVSIQAQILRLLNELQSRLNLTYLIISHDLRVIKYMCDDLVVMYLGRVVEQGVSEAVFRKPLHPYTSALIRSIPTHSDGKQRGSKLHLLEGEVPSPLHAPSGCHFHPRCPLRARLNPAEAKRCEAEIPTLRALERRRLSACHFAEKLG